MKVLPVSKALDGGRSETGPVTVRGWVRSRRDSKAGFSFIHLSDGSCFDALQIVAPGTLPNYQSEIARLTSGCSVIVRGVVTPSQGKGQAVELQAESVEVVGWIDDPEAYPIQPKRTSFEYLREIAHLRPRTNTLGAIAQSTSDRPCQPGLSWSLLMKPSPSRSFCCRWRLSGQTSR